MFKHLRCIKLKEIRVERKSGKSDFKFYYAKDSCALHYHTLRGKV